MKRTEVHSFFSAELELFGHPRSEGWSKGEKETCIQVQRTHDISWEDIKKEGMGGRANFKHGVVKNAKPTYPPLEQNTVGENIRHLHET